MVLEVNKNIPNRPVESQIPDNSKIQKKCVAYHSQLDSIHAKIYRYNTFLELVEYLQSTLLLHLPYIDYPSDEIFMMILTGTQLNHIDDPMSGEVINLSIPCIKYLNSVLRIFSMDRLGTAEDCHYIPIFDMEIENLFQRFQSMFSFFLPSPTQQRLKRPKKQLKTTEIEHDEYVIDDSMLDTSFEENMNAIENDLRTEKIDSVFGISTNSDKFNTSDTFFGIKYLSENNHDFWSYVQFSFKIASALTEVERMDSYEIYFETWSRWREFLNIVTCFMNIEFRRGKDISVALFPTLLLKITHTLENTMSQSTYLDCLLTFIDYTFINSKSKVFISSIISTDLTLSQNYIYSCTPSMLEHQYKGSGIGIDSIPLRVDFLDLCWKYVQRLPLKSKAKQKVLKKIAKKLMELNSRELLGFFSKASQLDSPDYVISNLFFFLSFELMGMMSRDWTMSPDNYLNDQVEYVRQIKQVFDSFSLAINIEDSQDLESEDEILFQDSYNVQLVEKCCIIAKYQLSLILKKDQLLRKTQRELIEIKFPLGDEMIFLNPEFEDMTDYTGII